MALVILSYLDGSIAALEKKIPDLSFGEIELLLDAERNGKTRKGAIALLEAALAEGQGETAEQPAVEGGDVAELEEEPLEEAPDEPETAEAVGPRRAEGEPPPGFETVENIVRESDITLHDGSHLLFGETASVPAGLAAEMRGRKQVR